MTTQTKFDRHALGRNGLWYIDGTSADDFIGEVTDISPPSTSASTVGISNQEPDGGVMIERHEKNVVTISEGSLTVNWDPQSVVQARLSLMVRDTETHTLYQRVRTSENTVREFVYKAFITGWGQAAPVAGAITYALSFQPVLEDGPISWFLPEPAAALSVSANDTFVVDLENYFAARSAIAYAVGSSDDSEASVAIAGTVMTVTAVAAGMVTITATATADGIDKAETVVVDVVA